MELLELKIMITAAEVELRALRRRLARVGLSPEPSNPFDPVGCLELWLAALYAIRGELLRSSGEVPARFGRLH